MSTIYIVRHGQSEANVDISAFEKYGNMQVPITTEGEAQIYISGQIIKRDLSNIGGLAVFSSMYHRCTTSAELLIKTIGIKIRVIRNILLSEINYGEQEGCDAENFEQRPVERMHRDRIGALLYRPYRGESFLDIHTRVGLFVVQQNFFQYMPVAIIVGHALTCLMLHYFLTQDCPDENTLNLQASEYWPNALVRKYTKNTSFEYNGILKDGTNDVLIPRDAES